MERHAQNYDVEAHMSTGYCFIIGLQVEAFACEGEIGVPDP